MKLKAKSERQEKSVAKQFKARTVVASGALWGAKGDVRNDKYLIECKTTDKGFYSLSAKVWEKIEYEAIQDHLRIPLMVIDIQGERFVVFKPLDFGVTPNEKYFIGHLKSTRIYSCELNKEGSFKYKGCPVRAISICGEKTNMLYCMKQKDFAEYFEEVK